MRALKNILLFTFLFANAANSQPAIEEKLIGDFYQTTVLVENTIKKCLKDKVWGNCVVIGLIKTAIAEFRTVGNIFRSFRYEAGKINITFNDGLYVVITPEELKLAQQYARFGKEANALYYDSAIIIYAGICKRIEVHKAGVYGRYIKCVNSFTDAMHFINSGYSTDNAGILLGLTLIEKDIELLPQLSAVLIRTSAHTAFCSNGVQDIMGNKFLIENGRMKNPASGPRPIKKVYVLRK